MWHAVCEMCEVVCGVICVVYVSCERRHVLCKVVCAMCGVVRVMCDVQGDTCVGRPDNESNMPAYTSITRAPDLTGLRAIRFGASKYAEYTCAPAVVACKGMNRGLTSESFLYESSSCGSKGYRTRSPPVKCSAKGINNVANASLPLGDFKRKCQRQFGSSNSSRVR